MPRRGLSTIDQYAKTCFILLMSLTIRDALSIEEPSSRGVGPRKGQICTNTSTFRHARPVYNAEALELSNQAEQQL